MPLIKTKLVLVSLVVISPVAGFVAARFARVEHALLPAQDSQFPWRAIASTDILQGGASSISMREEVASLDFDIRLSPNSEYPYATVGLMFDDAAHPERLLDWSSYSALRLRIKCRPHNVLNFVLHTFDSSVTKMSDITTFRPATTFLQCLDEWQVVVVDLRRLDVPEWWLRHNQRNLASQEFALDQVRAISFATSPQSPVDTPSNIVLDEIVLQGRNWLFIYITLVLIAAVWIGVLFLLARRARLKPAAAATSLVAYKQVTVEPRHERERMAVLEYLATKYVDPELSVDMVVNALGINRAKINDILREQGGMTFTAYLNNLRLTEAARLLAEKRMGVAEAAFAVGYGSVSYFNRVFKKQYGCTPSAYKAPAPDVDNSSISP